MTQELVKVTNYGARLMILIDETISIHDVQDCRKILKEWQPIKLIESKIADKEFKEKFNCTWEKTGKIEIKIPEQYAKETVFSAYL